MTNGILLKKLISEKGFTLSEFAERLGITRQELDNKITNKREFKQSEIQKSAEVLTLTREQVDYIFFNIYSDLQPTNNNAENLKEPNAPTIIHQNE